MAEKPIAFSKKKAPEICDESSFLEIAQSLVDFEWRRDSGEGRSSKYKTSSLESLKQDALAGKISPSGGFKIKRDTPEGSSEDTGTIPFAGKPRSETE